MKFTKKPGLMAAILTLLIGFTSRVEADYTVFATISDGYGSNSTLGSLDLTTGRFTSIANLSVNVISLTASPDGTLYGGGNDGNLYVLGENGTSTRFGSVSDPYRLSGLAASNAGGFIAVQSDLDPYGADSVKLSNDGNSISSPTFLGEHYYGFGSSGGALAYGPDALLYFDSISLSNSLPGPVQLFQLNAATGIATAIGSKLGVGYDPLALVSVGGVLYGIDTIAASGSDPIKIYTIDTKTGKATATGIDVTGLADGFTLDTAASMPAVVPEPSSLALVMASSGIMIARLLWTACRRTRVRT